MADIDADEFSLAIEKILSEYADEVDEGTTRAVSKGVRTARKQWSENAQRMIGKHEYRKHGKRYTSGKYAKSIKSHMTSRDAKHPSGEVGSTMPGLPHLLEHGHAIVGGGRTKAIEHIAPAADVAFAITMQELEKELT